MPCLVCEGAPDVNFGGLREPQLHQTREQANASPVVLLVQDTTDIDLSHRHKSSGVGQIGNEGGRGFFVQTVLAVCPQKREVLGCMADEPFVRIRSPWGARATGGEGLHDAVGHARLGRAGARRRRAEGQGSW